MAVNTLTDLDIVELRKYVKSGDRYRYWEYLTNKGDNYAKLAITVVTNESILGYNANKHFENYYENNKNKSLTSTESWAVRVNTLATKCAH